MGKFNKSINVLQANICHMMFIFQTVFYFDSGQQHFHEGLDRFAQFFIKPLMKVDSVDREIKAVDSGRYN